jgi:hypothetical protein
MNEHHLENLSNDGLFKRLTEAALAWGARKARVDIGRGCVRLTGIDGFGRPFDLEIGGSSREWHLALDRLAQNVVKETPKAGLCRWLNRTRIVRADARANTGVSARAV